MTVYISMLRGINVSGQKKIKMDELKKLYESLGFKNIKTYIQSGNVIFDFSDTNISKLINKIELKIKKSFSYDVPVLIKTKNDLQKLIANNPFVKKDSSKLYVTFLSDTPIQSPIDEITKIKDKSEEFIISRKEIYLFYPNGYGRSKLTNNYFERKLKLSATTRNWKTVNKLLELAE
ncbi:MAG: DUF1697 domain-containing protein [Bacteroidetes bacterium]|nr:DUF1697 domain-containing protein [Bacteroidota bacterium]